MPSSRRIGEGRGETLERVWIGQAVHRRVLAEALESIPGYLAERPVRFSFPVDDFTATLEGRVDGRFEAPSGEVVIDEVKSLHFADELPRIWGSPRLERYQLQLAWYLLAAARTEGRQVRGRLILADIETGATRTIERTLDADAVQADLEERVRALLDSFIEEQALAEAKASEAGTLSFPFPTYRPGQRELALAVSRSASQGEQLLAEAPTGIGKTAAALFPLVREALRTSRRLFVLTAKNTQQEIFRKTLEGLDASSLRSIRLRAKERMCANDVVLCHEDHCPYARDYGAKMEASGLVDRLLDSRSHLEPDLVFEEARSEVVCPFEVSLELAERADVVLGDYNYGFDPVVALSAFRDPATLAETLLLVDEVHNLVERGRSIYSPELRESDVLRWKGAFAGANPRTADSAHAAADAIERLLRRLLLGPSRDEPGNLGRSRPVRGRMARRAQAGDGVAPRPAPGGPASDRREGSRGPGPRHVLHVRSFRRRLPEGDAPRSPRPRVRPHRKPDERREPALAPLQGPLGTAGGDLQGGASRRRHVGDAHPAGVLPGPPRLRPREDRHREARFPVPQGEPGRSRRHAGGHPMVQEGPEPSVVANLVAGVARACPGHVLALFPSYRFLDDVRALLPALPGRVVTRPAVRSTELERNGALDSLRRPHPRVLLLAVSGGPFAEGVDYPGAMLEGVIVVSPALPQVRFEQERMREYFEERFGKGFEYAYVIPGMTRVVQSAGRLIRSETDRGVIALVCARFLMNPYRRYLPRDWYAENPDELAHPDLEKATAAFFDAETV